MVRDLPSDEECAFFAPFVIESGAQQGARPVTIGACWTRSSGSAAGTHWRDLPAELGNWHSVRRQYRRWTASGLWDVMLGRRRFLASSHDSSTIIPRFLRGPARGQHPPALNRAAICKRMNLLAKPCLDRGPRRRIMV
jgi:transposase